MDKFLTPTLYIRADAGNSIGVGHIMRCLGIAQSWQQMGGEVTFIVKFIPDELVMRLKEDGLRIIKIPPLHEIEQEVAWIEDQIMSSKSTIILLDGYHFSAQYQALLKHKFTLAVVDDFSHAQHYFADLIINRNLIAQKELYAGKVEPYTKLLLGMKYNFVRKEFIAFRSKKLKRPIQDIKRVLVNFGGADAKNFTDVILQYLKGQQQLEVVVVIGPAYEGEKQLQKTLQAVDFKVEVQRNVRNIAELMASVDIAIIAGGTTLFEVAYLGVPSISVKIADNQKSIDLFADKHHATLAINGLDAINENEFKKAWTFIQQAENRATMIHNAQQIVDHKGNERVIHELKKLLLKE